MGNPLACSVANASIDLLLSQDWQANIKRIESTFSAELELFDSLESVATTRCMGAIAVIEMKQPVNLAEIQKKFVEQGLWVRPFGKLVYLMPPFIMTDKQIEQLMRGVFGVLSEL